MTLASPQLRPLLNCLPVVGLVGVGLVVHEVSDDVAVAVVGGPVQRRPPVPVGNAGVRPAVQERPDHLGVALGGGLLQRRRVLPALYKP